MSFLVDPRNVSYEQIRQNLIDYVKSRSTTAAWKDFYESGTGVVMIELLASMMTYLQYMSAVSRRESYLAYAQNKSSLIAISETLGYSTYRGRNFCANVQFYPSTTIALPKLGMEGVSLGTFRGYGIYPLNSVVLNYHTDIQLEVVVGNLKTDIVTIENTSPNVFRYNIPNVSEDIVVLMAKDEDDLAVLANYSDETKIFEWPISKYLSDLVNYYSVALTNSTGSVDIFSLNNMLDSNGDPIYYGTDFTVLQLKFLEYLPLQVTLSEFLQEANWYYGSIVDPATGVFTNTIEVSVDKATKDEIRVNAPLAHETQLVVRGRDDYPKLLLLELNDNYGDCSSVKGHDVSAAVVELGYVLKKSGVLYKLTPTEVLALEEDYLQSARPFGVMPPLIGPIDNINDPTPDPDTLAARQYARAKTGGTGYEDEYHEVYLSGTITFYVSRISMLGVSTAQIESDLLAALQSYYYLLQGTFNIEQVEYDLEQLSWVKTVDIDLIDYLLWSETPPVTHTPTEISEIKDLTLYDDRWDWFYSFAGTPVGPVGSGADWIYTVSYI